MFRWTTRLLTSMALVTQLAPGQSTFATITGVVSDPAGSSDASRPRAHRTRDRGAPSNRRWIRKQAHRGSARYLRAHGEISCELAIHQTAGVDARGGGCDRRAPLFRVVNNRCAVALLTFNSGGFHPIISVTQMTSFSTRFRWP